MIPYAPTHLVEALLSYVAILGVLVVFSTDILAQRETSLSSISSWIYLSSFAAINCLYAYWLPSLISGKVLYGDLFTVVLASHALLADCFSVIRRPKLSRLRNRWIGGFAYALALLNAFFYSIKFQN